jgi:hypothetical protein
MKRPSVNWLVSAKSARAFRAQHSMTDGTSVQVMKREKRGGAPEGLLGQGYGV